MNTKYELALFAGAGGGILGGKLLGWKCIGAVECEDYPRGVLAQRQNDGHLDPFPIWDDVRTFRADNPDCAPYIERSRSIRNELVITGGFPCQDISAAGKGAGIEGEKSGLWREMARIIGEIRPARSFVENSPMLTVRGIRRVLGDLAEMGYDAQWGVMGADDAGAPHRRKRIWFVADSCGQQAYAECGGCSAPDAGQRVAVGAGNEALQQEVGQAGSNNLDGCDHVADADRERQQQPEGVERDKRGRIGDSGEVVGDSTSDRCGQVEQSVLGREDGEGAANQAEYAGITRGRQGWPVEPDVGRVAHGVASRVDRLKTIGNGQVPRVVKLAWEILDAQT